MKKFENYILENDEAVYYKFPCKVGDYVYVIYNFFGSKYEIKKMKCYLIQIGESDPRMMFKSDLNEYAQVFLDNAFQKVFYGYDDAVKSFKEMKL